MYKTRILLCSLLKPINDTRMFEKLGLSLQKLPDTEVHIVGFQSAIPEAPANIFYYPLFHFPRLSLNRLLAQLKYFGLLLKLRPHIVIISTHEFLLTSLIYKAFLSCQLIYDVRENYYLNLTTQKIYPGLVRQVLANGIRTIEKLAAPFIALFLLAEKSYAQELPFIKDKYIILQNKFKPVAKSKITQPNNSGIRLPQTGPIQLLYSGTIAELNGIYEAISFCDALHQVSPNFRLTIIGSWPQPKIGEKVHKLIKDKPYITLIGGDRLVPHEQILEAIQSSHVGLLPYQPNPSTYRCIPTKLYEYLANALPVVAQQNPYWEDIILTNQAGITIDYKHIKASDIIAKLFQSTFYLHANLEEFYWDSEENKLLSQLQQTILPKLR